MSTRSSIKWREQTDDAPGFHLYSDCFDDDPAPVYLCMDGVQAEMSATAGGASVTVTLPREIATEELKNSANADTIAWDDPTEYEAWAKSRARWALGKVEREKP